MIDPTTNAVEKSTDSTAMACALASETMRRVGDSLEQQMAFVRAMMDGFAQSFDEAVTGEHAQLVCDADADTLAEFRANNAAFATKLADVRASAETLATVLARLLTVFRFVEDQRP